MEDILVAASLLENKNQNLDSYTILTNNLTRITEEIKEQKIQKENKLPLKKRIGLSLHNFFKGIRDWRWTTWLRIVLIIITTTVILLCAILFRESIAKYMNVFLEWILNQGLLGAFVLIWYTCYNRLTIKVFTLLQQCYSYQVQF